MFVITKARIPVKIWAEQKDTIHFSDAIDQAVNLANHPLTQKWVALMPDFHVGYGMPIGGVIATKDGVIPNAVGVDIGCGMIATQTDVDATTLTKELLEEVRKKIHEKVPVGMNHHEKVQNHPYLSKKSLDKHQVSNDVIISASREAADRQIGTLGGGNHFMEVQKDQNNVMWIMLHSGSRNLGKKICDHYHGLAQDYAQKFHAAIPTKDLAFLPAGIPEYQMYLRAMKFAMGFAEESRKQMYRAIEESFKEVGITYKVVQQFDTHHNFAQMENHYGENYLIHRKGAVKAEGLVTIPGSMGTASYICEGLKPEESFNSCSHGAGRVMGRREANLKITHEEAMKAMGDVVFGVRQGDYDEMPQAYKDIHQVIADQKDLVKPVYTLLPLMVAKG